MMLISSNIKEYIHLTETFYMLLLAIILKLFTNEKSKQ